MERDINLTGQDDTWYRVGDIMTISRLQAVITGLQAFHPTLVEDVAIRRADLSRTQVHSQTATTRKSDDSVDLDDYQLEIAVQLDNQWAGFGFASAWDVYHALEEGDSKSIFLRRLILEA